MASVGRQRPGSLAVTLGIWAANPRGGIGCRGRGSPTTAAWRGRPVTAHAHCRRHWLRIRRAACLGSSRVTEWSQGLLDAHISFPTIWAGCSHDCCEFGGGGGMKCRLQESTSRQQQSRWRAGWFGVAAWRGGRQLGMSGDDKGGCGQQHSVGDAPAIGERSSTATCKREGDRGGCGQQHSIGGGQLIGERSLAAICKRSPLVFLAIALEKHRIRPAQRHQVGRVLSGCLHQGLLEQECRRLRSNGCWKNYKPLQGACLRLVEYCRIVPDKVVGVWL